MLRKCKKCGSDIPGMVCMNPKCGLLQPKIGPKTFEEFMALVNKALDRIMGLSASDISDYDYRRAWDSNKSPEATAKLAAKNAGF